MAVTTKLTYKSGAYYRTVYVDGVEVGGILQGSMGIHNGAAYGLHYRFKPAVTEGHPLYQFGIRGQTIKEVVGEIERVLRVMAKRNSSAAV